MLACIKGPLCNRQRPPSACQCVLGNRSYYVDSVSNVVCLCLISLRFDLLTQTRAVVPILEVSTISDLLLRLLLSQSLSCVPFCPWRSTVACSTIACLPPHLLSCASCGSLQPPCYILVYILTPAPGRTSPKAQRHKSEARQSPKQGIHLHKDRWRPPTRRSH
jgi:hypothetical protein